MALIHWWPLNDASTDKGTEPLALIPESGVEFSARGLVTTNTATFLSSSRHSHLKGTDIARLTELSEYTLSCWVYLTDKGVYNGTVMFLSSGNFNSTGKFITFGLSSYNASTGFTVLNIPNHSSCYGGISLTGDNIVKLNKWYHIAVTYKNGDTYGYINGNYVGRYAGSKMNTTTDNFYYIGAATYYEDFTVRGRINDFRIYDNALSKQEIKELSQGLAIHLTFNDTIGEGTTNLYYNKIQGFKGKWETLTETFNGFPVYRNTVTNPFTGSNDADNFGFCHTTTITHTQSQATHPYITLSFWKRLHEVTGLSTMYGYVYVTYTDDTHVQLQWSNYNKPNWSNDPTSIGKWEKITAVAKLATGKTIKNITHMYVYGRNCTGGKCDFACIQIEAKDHPTPYVAGERPYHIVNEAGYDDPISVSNLDLSTDTNCGTYCGVFNSNRPTQIRMNSTLTGATDVSVACWIYPQSGSSAFTDNALYSVISGTDINLYAYGRSTSWLYCSKCLTFNAWNHVVTTYSATERVVYVNGKKVGSDTISGTFDARASLDIGYGSTTTRAFNGRISDFRLYGTTLSENDVKNLYESKASVDKGNNVFSNEFIEEKGDNLVSIEDWEQGGLYDDGSGNADGMSNRLRTKFIPVLGGLSYTFSCSSPCKVRCVHCYTETNTWIGVVSGGTVTLPNNCAYVRWVIQDSRNDQNAVPVSSIATYNPIMIPTLLTRTTNISSSTDVQVGKKYTVTSCDMTYNSTAGFFKTGKLTGHNFIEN